MKNLFFLCMVGLLSLTGRLACAQTSEMLPPSDYESQYCEAHLQRHHAVGESLEAQQAALAAELVDFSRLSEETLSVRAKAILLYQELKEKVDQHQALNGRDLQRMNEGAAFLLAQREALLKVAKAHECWVYAPVPKDPEALAIRATAVSMSLSAALLLYDNYLIAIAPFHKAHNLRRHFNRADSGFEIRRWTLNSMAFEFNSDNNRMRTLNALEWWDRHARRLEYAPFEQYGYLTQLILQSPSQNLVRKTHSLRNIGKPFALLSKITLDSFFAIKDEGVSLTSQVFGNTVGLIETRRGKLDGKAQLTTHISHQLQAGDILLEKTPFRLTDRFIPGHWGHAAIWIGSEEELRELGIWDHPVVRQHHSTIRNGRSVVEALRSGVKMNPLSQFLNIDDLAVLRQEAITPTRRAEIILQTLRQVGKDYDFNFDAETTHRIFCSKLIYLAYGDLQWPTSRILDKTTVTPDDIALHTQGDGPLNVVLLYLNGEPIQENPRLTMKRLLRSDKLTRPVQQASLEFRK